MRYRRLRQNLKHAARRGLVAAGLLAFLVATLGLPLPSGARKDRSIPFPCMDRPCGCHDASGCKEHCCCFTGDQKLAWAARHGVDPTPFVNFSLIAVTPPPADLPGPDLARSCCTSDPHQLEGSAIKGSALRVQGSEIATDAHQPKLLARHCDEVASGSSPVCRNQLGAQRRDATDTAIAPSSDLPSDGDDAINIVAYRSCHGLAPLWTTLGAALPPPDPTAYEILWNSSEAFLKPPRAAASLSFSPPTPPPRS